MRPSSTTTLAVGMAVEARYQGGAEWFAGVVDAVYPDNTYDITYDDGDSEGRVPAELIRGLGQPTQLAAGIAPAALIPGTAIEALFEGGPEWYAGVVAASRMDGTYDITYNDGDQEIGVPRDAIRLAGGGPAAMAAGDAAMSFPSQPTAGCVGACQRAMLPP